MKKIATVASSLCLLFALNLYAQEDKTLPEQASEVAKEIISNPGKLKVEKIGKKKFKGQVESFVLDKEGNPNVVEIVKEESSRERIIRRKRVQFLLPDGTVRKELVKGDREVIKADEEAGYVIKQKIPEMDEKGFLKNKGDKLGIEIYSSDGELVVQDEVGNHEGYVFSSEAGKYVMADGLESTIYLRDAFNKKTKKIKLFGDYKPKYWKTTARPVYSPDGQYIGVSALKDKDERYFILYDRDGNELWRKKKEETMFIYFSPNNSYVISGKTLYTIDGKELGTYVGGPTVFSPDESFFVYRYGSEMGMINTKDGSIAWKKPVKRGTGVGPKMILNSKMIIFEDYTRVGNAHSNPAFFITDIEGEELYRFTIEKDDSDRIQLYAEKNKLYFIVDDEVYKFSIR